MVRKRKVMDKAGDKVTTAVVALARCALCLLAPPLGIHAATTIDAANKYAYAANLGWMDWRGDTNHGAVIGEYVCSGYLYGANVGWINLGNGNPANLVQYQNNSASDFGVNQDGLGNLRGFAWGANIGWINFENSGAPRVDLLTGKFSGYAYSANCGWILLSNAFACVQAAAIQRGALAANGLPIAWLLQNFGTTNVSATADADGDGASNAQEYLAGTNPNDPASVLRITRETRGTPTPTFTTLQWNSVATRAYAIQSASALGGTNTFTDYAVLSLLGANNAGFDTSSPRQYYRIRAFRPLTP